MSSAVIASGIVAAVAFGFGEHSQAMLKAGSKRLMRPVLDTLTLSLSAWLMMFAAALAGLYLLPIWAGRTIVVLALLYLVLTGVTRYLAQPQPGNLKPDGDQAPAFLVARRQLRSGEAWALVMFVAGSAITGSMTLAVAFAGLTLLITTGLCLWAAAGWTGCQTLSSAWHRRHLDWAFGIFLFVAGTAALLPN